MSNVEELQRTVETLGRAVFERHDCEGHLELRIRNVAGGATHVVSQCQVCGRQRGGPLSKAKAAVVLRGAAAPAFDEGLEQQYSAVRQRLHEEWAQASRELNELTDPEAVRRADATQQESAARATALKAAEERVRSALDTAVREAAPIAWNHRLGFVISHLQRAHPAALRDPAPRPVRGFTSEPELRDWLDAWISEDFHVLREVPRRHLTEGTRVKLDYVITPRIHLLQAGFKPGPLGLEVKHLPVDGGFSPKASRFIWQAVSYTDCEFELEDERVRLPRVLLFSNMSFDDELEMLRGIEHSVLSNDRAKWAALLELANHANVGNVEMYGTRDRRDGWRIAFATGIYFRRRGSEFSLSNPNLFEKVRIGNF
jgi:hypothetical protein